MSDLRIGVIFRDLDRLSAGHLGSTARFAEELGMDSLFMGDHLLPAMPYPESTVVMSATAAATERIRIGFGVMVLALRPVAWAAKQIATLQHVSENRVILGVGTGGELHGRAGWDAVGVPYAERGRRTDEALEILPRMISGEKTRVQDVEISLQPGATPPPMWIGGGSKAAIRRSAKYGDGWFPSMVTPEFVASGADRVRELAAELGRAAPSVTVGGAVGLGTAVSSADIDETVRGLSDGYGIPADDARRVPITGSPAEAAERFAEFADAGARHLVLGTIGDDWRKQWELIAEARALLG